VKLDKVRLGSTLAIVWGLSAFLTGLGNLIWNRYGIAFLKVLESIYPGYTFGRWGFWGVIVVTLYAALDGFVIGVVIAWIYNLLKCEKKEKE
jgi:hypothetical protein